jgi:hypothetical protein
MASKSNGEQASHPKIRLLVGILPVDEEKWFTGHLR